MHDVQGIEGAQQFDSFPNPSVELANPSPSVSNHPFPVSSLNEICPDVSIEQTKFDNDAPSRSDDACDISDSEFFETEETLDESKGHIVMHVVTEEPKYEEENMCKQAQLSQEINLDKQQIYPDINQEKLEIVQGIHLENQETSDKVIKKSLNPFEDEVEDVESCVDPGDSEEDESLISVIQVGKIGLPPATVVLEPAPLSHDAPTVEDSAYTLQVAAAAEASAIAAKVIKKARAPPPPVVSRSESSQSVRNTDGPLESLTSLVRKPEDFIERISRNPIDEESSKVLYQSPGFNDKLSLANPSHYPSLANSPPLSPESRLKRNMALLSPEPLIKETPVPFQTPTKVLTYSPRQGITRLRTYANTEESPSREASKLDVASGDVTRVEESGEPSTASRCPHCTIHNWLPHSPSCPKIKKK